MRNVKYRQTPRWVFPINGCAPSDWFISPVVGHGYTSVAAGVCSIHKTLPSPLAKFRELQPASKTHTFIGKAQEITQPCRHKNSFIVAKPSEPTRFSCNLGALLLFPPSLVRAVALRSIFIHLAPA